jgi:peptidoglycan biosynthesis protein MviN/MurJ (putative lipid II flippase)
VLNVVLAFALYPHFGVLGLGLAFALAYLITAAWALQILHYKVGGFELRGLFTSIGKTALAGLVMAELVWFAYRSVGSNTGLGAAARLLIAAAVGPAVYVGVMWLLGSDELRRARELVAGRLSRAR